MPDHIIALNLDKLDAMLAALRSGRRLNDSQMQRAVRYAIRELVEMRRRSADAHHLRIERLMGTFTGLKSGS